MPGFLYIKGHQERINHSALVIQLEGSRNLSIQSTLESLLRSIGLVLSQEFLDTVPSMHACVCACLYAGTSCLTLFGGNQQRIHHWF